MVCILIVWFETLLYDCKALRILSAGLSGPYGWKSVYTCPTSPLSCSSFCPTFKRGFTILKNNQMGRGWTNAAGRALKEVYLKNNGN